MAPRATEPRDALLTALVVLLVVSFLALGWWQVTRALSGNGLSWAYVFEWPLFAGYVVYMWRRLSRERAAGGDRAAAVVSGDTAAAADTDAAAYEEPEDEELAAYNRYLASLEESGRRKRW